MNNNKISIMAQGFYGNRTATSIDRDDIDRFVLGYLDKSLEVKSKIDRSIIRVPNTDNIVIVYNKYQEEETRLYNNKPYIVIPENNIEIYSRCIVCKMNNEGELESLQNEDCDKFIKYLAE